MNAKETKSVLKLSHVKNKNEGELWSSGSQGSELQKQDKEIHNSVCLSSLNKIFLGVGIWNLLRNVW